MNRGVYALLGAQFLSAFADNAILFTAIAMVHQAATTGDWYVPALQSAFLVAFVVLAPWVGALADARPKRSVLILGNSLKAAGAGLLFVGVEPLVAFVLVGAGAAVYGPAKYGILPELVDASRLVRANGWVEGSTIFAIILGTALGARLADHSIALALITVCVCYGVSILVTLIIPRIAARRQHLRAGLLRFVAMMRRLLSGARARFSMLGASLFWAAAAVLRLLLVAWAPQVLGTTNVSQIADLTLTLALGIIAGALLVPRLIPLEHLRRARLAAYAMGVAILIFSLVDSVWPARLALFAIGICGGLFMVPVNAALQEIGHQGVGSGGAVALQNFFENVAMLVSVGAYTYAAAHGTPAVNSIVVVGILVLIAAAIVSWRLPPDTRDVSRLDDSVAEASPQDKQE